MHVFGVLFVSLAIAVGASAKPQQVDVVIVGAGAAGMAAASALLRESDLTLAVLEARAYTGGRVHARAFGAKRDIVIEEAANWVHGEPPPGGSGRMANPAWALAQRAHLATVRIPGSCANTSGYALFDANGHEVSGLEGKAQRRADAAFNCVNATAFRMPKGHDITFAQGLAQCGFKAPPVGSVEDALYWEITAANYPMKIDVCSLKWSLPDPTYEYFGPDDHFVHDQRPRGYASALDELFSSSSSSSSDNATSKASPWPDNTLHLGAVVRSIEETTTCDSDGKKKMLVQTADGRAFCASHVISSLPLGVMQHDQARIFSSPALSKPQVAGLDAFTMGNFSKIFVQFKTRFWATRGTQWLIANDVHEGGGLRGPMEFHDLGALIEGANTLFTYVAGDDTGPWSRMTDAEASAALVKRLQGHFPDVDVGEPTAFYMTRHAADPYMRGAYSVVKLGVSMDQFNDMLKPHADGKVFWAGEHTCAAFQGYVHGGLYSGWRGAAQVLLARGDEAAARRVYDWSCEKCARPAI